jgi:hypothetical protein
MSALTDTLYLAWIIGTKDILEALRNKSTRNNLVVMAGMVFFFYWLAVVRPFDRDVSVVVYDAGHTSLAIETVKLADGATYTFHRAASLPDMENKMAYRNLGLALPADLDQTLAAGGTPDLKGFVFWADRKNVAALEARYSLAFSQILGRPARVVIGAAAGEGIVIPQANADGMHSNLANQLVYFVFWTALSSVPYLMWEERQSKTLDALLTSPASPGQVVLGKALAGLFYVLVVGGTALALFSPYIVHWGAALAAFAAYVLFAVGIALAVGIFINSIRQLGLWSVAIILSLVIPALFHMEANLKPAVRTVLSLFPSAALANLFRFGCSTGVAPANWLPDLALVMGSIGLTYGLIVWKVSRADRE